MNPINSNLITLTYLLYLALSIGLTWWVAQTLHANGKAFLIDAFGGEELADSVNQLLVVGFYLINLGYICFVLRMSAYPRNLPHAIELLSTKIGTVLIVLGLMHFMNIYIFSRFRNSARMSGMAAPIGPEEYIEEQGVK